MLIWASTPMATGSIHQRLEGRVFLIDTGMTQAQPQAIQECGCRADIQRKIEFFLVRCARGIRIRGIAFGIVGVGADTPPSDFGEVIGQAHQPGVLAGAIEVFDHQ